MSKYKVLFVGESWFFSTTETKGTDQFTIGGYETEIARVKSYMKEFAELIHIPAHLVPEQFPENVEELKKYDIVLVSDVGANTFLLHPDTFFRSWRTSNKLEVIKDYVRQGGAFGMIGGYMTFMGIEGKGRYKGTVIEEILPVVMSDNDDRKECPQGFSPEFRVSEHSVTSGLRSDWKYLLGYNQVTAKKEGIVLLEAFGDPLLTVWDYGQGRTFAWTSDCAPHWMPAEFCESEQNKMMWHRLFDWCTKRDV